MKRSICLNKDIQFPLWKNNFSQDDLGKIKKCLSDHRADLEPYGLEIAICFAEWWRTQYDGGIPSISQVLMYVCLEEVYETAFKNSAYGFLNHCSEIEVMRGQTNNLYFRTLLLQGGFPLSMIAGNNASKYRTFLIHLVKELQNIEDLENIDTSIIFALECRNDLPENLLDETLRSLSLMIAKAAINHDTDALPFDVNDGQFKNLVTALQNEVKPQKLVPCCTIDWQLVIHHTEGQWKYDVDFPTELEQESIDQTVPAYLSDLYLMVAGKQVAHYMSYKKAFKRIHHIDSRFIWMGEPRIDVRVKGFDLDASVSCKNTCPPMFDEPVVLYGSGSIYTARRKDHAACPTIFFDPELWTSDGETESVKILDHEYRYVSFEEKISLTNRHSGQSETFDGQDTGFSVDYSYCNISWLKEANINVVSRFPQVKVYGRNGEPIMNRTVYFRSYHESDWTRLNFNSDVPKGLFYIKTVLPGSRPQVDRFYNIGDLKPKCSYIKKDTVSLVFPCDWGSVHMVNVPESLTVEGGNGDFVLHLDEPANCPDTIDLKLFSEFSPTLELKMYAPFRILQIQKRGKDGRWSDLGTEVMTSVNLSNYRILKHATPNAKITLKFNNPQIQYDGPSLKFRIPFKGTHNMLDFKDYIDLMFYLYGSSYGRDTSNDYVQVTIGGCNWFIQRYDTVVRFDQADAVFLLDGSDTSLFGQAKVAYRLQGQTEFKVFCLDKDSDNRFVIPSYDENADYVIFSDKADWMRFCPFRRNPCAIDKEAFEEKLSQGDECIWNFILSEYDLAVKERLPFGLFSELHLICTTPEYLAEFICRYFLKFKQELETEDEVRIFYNDFSRLEKELAVSLHWIRRNIWESLTGKCSSENLSGLIDFIVNLMNVSQGEVLTRYILQGQPDSLNQIRNDQFNELKSLLSNNAVLEYSVNATNEYCVPVYGFSCNPASFPDSFNQLLEPLKTIMHIPAYVCEYLVEGKHNTFWNKPHLRRYVTFYKTVCSELYFKMSAALLGGYI